MCKSRWLPYCAVIFILFTNNLWVNSHLRSMYCTRWTVTLQSHHFFHLLSCSADNLAHTFILSVITFKYFKSTPEFVFHFHAVSQFLMICHKDFFQHHKCNILMHHEWKWKVKVKSLSRVQLSVTPWTVAYHAPLPMGFSRQEYCSWLPFPSPDDLPNPGIEPRSTTL